MFGKPNKTLRDDNAQLTMNLLGAASELKRHAHEVGGDGGVVPWTNVELRVGGLRANLQIGVAQGVADGVNADEGAGTEEVDPLKITRSGGIELCPLAVHVLGQQLQGVNGLLGGAAGGQAVHIGAGSTCRSILNVL